MNYFETCILALAQGLTEFLPISSSGHLVLLPILFGFKDPGLAVDAFLHLGTLFAVLVYFRKDIQGIIQGLVSKNPESIKLGLGITIASIPAIIIGFGFKDFFGSEGVRSIKSIIITLVLGSLLMFFAEKSSKRSKQITELNYLEMLFVGCLQALALFPGTSRSGATLSGGLFCGLQRQEAARFAFLVGLPAIFGASVLAIKDLASDGSITDSLPVLGTGLLVSFISGYIAIDILIRFLKNNSPMIFVFYRLLLALILIKQLY